MVCSRGGVRTAACGAVCVMPDRMAERVGRSVWLWGGRVVVLVVFTRSRPVTRSPAYSARLSRLLRPSRMASHLRSLWASRVTSPHLGIANGNRMRPWSKSPVPISKNAKVPTQPCVP